MQAWIVLALSSFALAVPLEERQAAAPSVTIRNGTVTGTTSGGIDSFSGIPFAQPPVGSLRLRPPQPLVSGFPSGQRTFAATSAAAACPQFAFQVDNINLETLPQDVVSDVIGELIISPIGQKAINQKEDCLTITVQRPAGTTATSKLPVIFWVYGGGFEAGWSAMYDGSNFVKQSVRLGKPVIYVAVNYRVGGFGFLAGKELAAERSTNLGLRDQRLGMKWAQENIAAFGGDPTKVTIWGESAGAISVADHTIFEGGNIDYNGGKLFRAAIMNSGTIVPATDVSSPKAQAIYDQVVRASSCAGNTNSLACLRALPFDAFNRAVASVPGIFSYRSLDLSYLPRPDPGDNFFPQSPEVPFQAGRFAKVPVIVGDQEDEGSLFALVQSNISTNDQLVNYVASYFPADPNNVANARGLADLYPNQPLLGQPAGSPFRTAAFNSIYPQFKRLAAILGDITFTITRRSYLDVITKQGVPAWSYLSTFLYGTPVLGTFHASDIFLAAFADAQVSLQARSMQTYYIAFINNLDPNSLGTAAPLISWPKWTNATTQLVNFESLRNSLLTDDFRSNVYNYLVPRISTLRI
ncbi:Putative carboxylesterase, type B, carboxylesterase type B, active, alpha/Beta hydrolase [Septoria linicola]|uniref:Carboxylic ester hydrolase n=1 Tax=Septoria linicola TaxID=215465 RepID=A0A9Q9AZ61_9PEZI|nr:putative carboxylesterase, type B, carboxylesterase type B, active, alpha/Beta hydrolase [Septoria linicola]USW54718.1 Putative carboxylesterase, type B, carboxylesterase type B, active, alpha/Beta hydrolase [Septoria linicola]